MKRLLILLIFQMTSVFAVESLCETALTDLRALKLNYLRETDRTKAIILKDSYGKKIKELATKSGISINDLENAISQHKQPATNVSTISTVKTPINAQDLKNAEIEKLFKSYPHYEELVEKAKEFSDYFISQQEINPQPFTIVFYEFLESKFSDAQKKSDAYIQFEQAIILFLSLQSHFIEEQLVGKYTSSIPPSQYSLLLFYSIKRADFILAKILINHFEAPTNKILPLLLWEAVNDSAINMNSNNIKYIIYDLNVDTNIDSKTFTGRNILHEVVNTYKAAKVDNKTEVMEFILNLAEEIIKVNPDLLEGRNDRGFTPIFESPPELLKLFLKYKANPNAKARNGNTPLYQYIFYNDTEKDPEVLEILLKAGADPSIKNNNGHTPFSYAKSLNVENILKIFEKYGIRE